MSSESEIRCPGSFGYFFGRASNHIVELQCRDCSRAMTKRQRPGERAQVFHRLRLDDDGRAKWLDKDRVIIGPDVRA